MGNLHNPVIISHQIINGSPGSDFVLVMNFLVTPGCMVIRSIEKVIFNVSLNDDIDQGNLGIYLSQNGLIASIL